MTQAAQQTFAATTFDQWTLPNGLRIIGERLPYLRSVSVGVWLKVGSMMEQDGNNGLSHFLEHMVFKGTARRNTLQIAREMDAVGGMMNAFTGKDCTCYYAKVIDENLPLAVDLLADLTLNAALAEEEFQKERGVILEEIAMEEDDPEDLAHELLNEALYGKAGPGRPILGVTAGISRYTRDDLLTFRQQHYRPQATVVSICGNYDPGQVEALMEAHFGVWQGNGPGGEYESPAARCGQLLVREKDTEQLNICIGYPGIPYGHPDVAAMGILNNVLGAAMSSRLFQRIREELGMAYSIYSTPNHLPGCGSFTIFAGVSPKNGERVCQEIQREIHRLLQESLTPQEFAESKALSKGSFVLGLESSNARMSSMGRGVLMRGYAHTPQEIIDRIEAVTQDDVMRLAQLLTAAPCITATGKGASRIRLP